MTHRNINSYLTLISLSLLQALSAFLTYETDKRCLSFNSTALLVYEYCITFAMEVERVWNTGYFTWAILFFYLNRYLTLLGHAPVVVEFFWYSEADNKPTVSDQAGHWMFNQLMRIFHWIDVGFLNLFPYVLQSLRQRLGVTISKSTTNVSRSPYRYWCLVSVYHHTHSQLLIASPLVLIMMRMYAIYGQSRRILGLFLGVMLVVVIVACVRFSLHRLQLPETRSCLQCSLFTGKGDTNPNKYLLPVGCAGMLSRYAWVVPQ